MFLFVCLIFNKQSSPVSIVHILTGVGPLTGVWPTYWKTQPLKDDFSFPKDWKLSTDSQLGAVGLRNPFQLHTSNFIFS